MKFCISLLRATPALPAQTFFRLRVNTFLVGKSFRFSTIRLRFVACWFSFTRTLFRSIQKRCVSEIPFQYPFDSGNWTNLLQACSANQHQVIMAPWLPKLPSWLRKNSLYVSQSEFSNFAPHDQSQSSNVFQAIDQNFILTHTMWKLSRKFIILARGFSGLAGSYSSRVFSYVGDQNDATPLSPCRPDSRQTMKICSARGKVKKEVLLRVNLGLHEQFLYVSFCLTMPKGI